jgi:hypothetical protein
LDFLIWQTGHFMTGPLIAIVQIRYFRHDRTEMFADLGTLIVKQVTMLDLIGEHLEVILDDLHVRTIDYRKADGDQKLSTK